MNRKIALGIAALVGLSTMSLTLVAAARPLPPVPGYHGPGPVVQARYWRGYGPRYYGPRYYGPRYYGPPPGYYYGRGGYYYNDGATAALGVLGGLALGGAIAAGAAPHYYAPVCHFERREVWVPGWGYRIRRVEVCN